MTFHQSTYILSTICIQQLFHELESYISMANEVQSEWNNCFNIYKIINQHPFLKVE